MASRSYEIYLFMFWPRPRPLPVPPLKTFCKEYTFFSNFFLLRFLLIRSFLGPTPFQIRVK
jgi:hypothetical protein